MTMYGVTVSKIFDTVIEIDAENAESAVRKVLAGEGEEYERFNEVIIVNSSGVYSVVEEYTGYEEEVRLYG